MPFHLNRPIGELQSSDTPVIKAPPRRKIGVNCFPNNPIHLAGAKQLGVMRIRSTLYWVNWPDGSPGEIVAACADAKIDLLMVIHTPPKQYEGDRTNGTPALAALCADRAAAWPGLQWQIMNEMDGADSYNGSWFQVSNSSITNTQRGQWYGEVLAACGQAIRKADPTAKVIGGGIALDPTDFVRGVLQTCPRTAFDALAIHAYGQPDIYQFTTKAEAVRAIDPTIPLWCTEFGSMLVDESAQSAELAQVFADNDGNMRYERAYLYALEDESAGYGIMSHAGVMRSASTLMTDRTAD